MVRRKPPQLLLQHPRRSQRGHRLRLRTVQDASQWLPALHPMAGFDSGPLTSAGADFNVSTASITYIASTNTSLLVPTDRASHTSVLPWSVVELPP